MKNMTNLNWNLKNQNWSEKSKTFEIQKIKIC